jgi:hypothetical protein
MQNAFAKRLDDDADARIRELGKKVYAGEKVDIMTAFAGSGVANAMSEGKIILPTFEARRILSSVGFYRTVGVRICPGCTCVREIDSGAPIIESGAIMPILIAPYSRS